LRPAEYQAPPSQQLLADEPSEEYQAPPSQQPLADEPSEEST